MDHEGRRARFMARFEPLGVDAFLVTRLPNVCYLTGFTGSNGQLLLSAGDGVFLTDGRYIEQSRHQVPDFKREIYSNVFAPSFAKACAELGVNRVGFETNGVTYKTYLALAETGGVELVPTESEVDRLRWVKERPEVELLGAAQAIADEAFARITGTLTAGMSEKQVAADLESSMRHLGADGLSFETIVAFGESAAEPHHEPTDRSLRRGDMVKIDFGCVLGGYHTDMTRTFAFGDPGDRMRELYELVRRAQQAGVEAVRPGVTGGEADRAAREVIAAAGFGDQYSHSLGHGVGLEVHEGPNLRSGGEDVIPEGTVVTVEPGVYVARLGGVRIEDMVEVTADGARVIPRTTKELLVL